MRILIIARNRTVATEGDLIVPPEGAFDIVIRAPQADVRPGLINAHDHLHRNHYGRLGNPPYANALSWARDIQLRHRDHIAGCRSLTSLRDALLAGAWKNLRAGVTTVVHHDRWEADFDDDFPLRVVRIEGRDSLDMSDDVEALAHKAGPVMLHVAEGVGRSAGQELDRLYALGLLDQRLLAVHCVGLSPGDVEKFERSGAALVWCPTSNLFLFGRTAPGRLFNDDNDVLLGSDSLLTADGDLLDELRRARALGMLDDERLEDAVGRIAARRLNLQEPSLEPGSRADIVLISAPLLQARARDVQLVIASGIPRIANPEIARQFGEFAESGHRLVDRSRIVWANSAQPKVDRILKCA